MVYYNTLEPLCINITSPAQINCWRERERERACWMRAPRRSRDHLEACPSLSFSRAVSSRLDRTAVDRRIHGERHRVLTSLQTSRPSSPAYQGPGACPRREWGQACPLTAAATVRTRIACHTGRRCQCRDRCACARSVAQQDKARRRNQCSFPTSLVALLARTSVGTSTHRQLTCYAYSLL